MMGRKSLQISWTATGLANVNGGSHWCSDSVNENLLSKTGKNLFWDWLVSEYIAPSGGVVKSSGTYNHKKKFQYRTHDVPVTNFSNFMYYKFSPRRHNLYCIT